MNDKDDFNFIKIILIIIICLQIVVTMWLIGLYITFKLEYKKNMNIIQDIQLDVEQTQLMIANNM